jgi:hypothetical protein
MTPQTFTEQGFMRVMYNEEIYLATMKMFFCAGTGYFTISNGKELAQVRTVARINNFRLCSKRPGRTSPKQGLT